MFFDAFLRSRSKATLTLASLVLLGLLALLDYYTNPEVSLSLFYLAPIALLAWYTTPAMGMLMSILAAAAWLLSDATSGHEYSHVTLLYWNALVRLGFFVIVSYLISKVYARLDLEEDRAETDPLTGALNVRGFYEQVAEEVERTRRYRHPFTLAYLDLDNFKWVNDAQGHDAGDRLLREIVAVADEATRKSDIIGRLGGDEFAILFIETSSAAASTVLDQLRSRILQQMREANWPVTVSIGAVTYEDTPEDVRQVIRFADNLMYSVKRRGKNGVARAVWRSGSGETVELIDPADDKESEDD